jgi:putative sigma-54 modulation protein
MHKIITGIHVEVTQAIRNYTMEKLEAIEKYIPEGDTSAKISVDLSRTTAHHSHGDVFQAEALLHVRGKDITLRAVEDDMYKAIDVLKDMLTRELASYKDKERSIFRRSAHKVKNLLKRIKN